MLEINTIKDFLSLPTNVRDDIQKAIRAKDRLDDFLRSQNHSANRPIITPHWEACKKCTKWNQPGWVWVEEHKRDNSDIHPSQMDRCLKSIVYACSGQADNLERIIEPRFQQLLDLGTAWHSVMQGYGKSGAWGNPEVYHPEVSIDPDAVDINGNPVHELASYYWIKGHVDAIIDRYEVNVPGLGPIAIRLVHEYKTININGFSKLNRPKPEHKMQATIYSAVFDIPIVVYLYTNKDDNKMADYPVPFDHTIWNDVINKINKVQDYTEANQLPPWEETSAVLNPMECGECGYRRLCQPPLKKLGK